jgi:hypothetical protein
MFSSFQKNTLLIFSATFTNKKVVKKKEEFLLIFLKNTLLIFSKLIIVREKKIGFELSLGPLYLKVLLQDLRKKALMFIFKKKKVSSKDYKRLKVYFFKDLYSN